jgi:hypothetical protein
MDTHFLVGVMGATQKNGFPTVNSQRKQQHKNAATAVCA